MYFLNSKFTLRGTFWRIGDRVGGGREDERRKELEDSWGSGRVCRKFKVANIRASGLVPK